MSNESSEDEDDLQVVIPVDVTARLATKIQIAKTSLHLFIQLTASFIAAALNGWIPKQRRLFHRLKGLLVAPHTFVLSSKFPFSSLTSITHHSTKFEILYQAISKPIVYYRSNSKWFHKKVIEGAPSLNEHSPEPSVHVDVLYDPYPNPIRADVIFIHGLHGSLYNTWKQGLWGYRKEVQNFALNHKYKIQESKTTKVLPKCVRTSNRQRFSSTESCNTEYDQLLENITDLLNNIDDTLKDTKPKLRDKEEPYSSCWPRDWIPKDCPGVRVIAVNYTTDPFLWRPVWVNKRKRSSLSQRSQEMEDLLIRLGVGSNQIVWVGHSKGGLYVKQMLVDARYSGDSLLARFLPQTKGIMFYSVPHRGSSLANWNLPFLRQSVELTEVKKNCNNVIELHNKFLKLFEEKFLSAEVFSFVETELTFMFVTNVRVVSVDSADLGLGSFRGVNIDHREICKPLNRDCFLYKELINLINRILLESSPLNIQVTKS